MKQVMPRYCWIWCVVAMALGACAKPQHRFDRYLSQLRPDTIVPLTDSGWAAGTLLCPLTPYQQALPATTPVAARVNDFLKRRQFVGDEDHWSLVVINPASAGDSGMDHLIFRRGNYDVVTEERRVLSAAASLPGTFSLQTCVAVEEARLLVTRAGSQRTSISFGTS